VGRRVHPFGWARTVLPLHHNISMLRRIATIIAISNAISLLVAVGVLVAQRATELPPPYATRSVRNQSHVVPRPAGAQLHVPEGFSIQSWAERFGRPRFMLEGARGEVFIADS